MKFKLTRIGGGYHPIIDIKFNGRKAKALIDTGANRTIITKGQIVTPAEIQIDKYFFKVSTDYVKSYPMQDVEAIIGTDIFTKLGAKINFKNNTIVFKK
jgi:predicted aspartyl protease